MILELVVLFLALRSEPTPARRVELFYCWRGRYGCEPTGSLVYPAGPCSSSRPPASSVPTPDELAACQQAARDDYDVPALGVTWSCEVRAVCGGS